MKWPNGDVAHSLSRFFFVSSALSLRLALGCHGWFTEEMDVFFAKLCLRERS